MLVNQRPYQLIYSRTGSKAAAYAVALSAKALGCTAAFGASFLCRKEQSSLSFDQLNEAAERIYPKPEFSLPEPAPLPNRDPDCDLSVIVPVHNSEKYIESCAESVLSQKSGFNVQLILVDDGSLDSSPELLKKYADLPGVSLITHPEGKNAASARNSGLLQARGEYLMFLDSDDILCPGAVQALMQSARTQGADIVQGSWKYIDEDGNPGHSQIYADHCYEGRTRCHVTDLPGMPWAKVYRRSLFERIRFPYSYSCFEDAIIHFLVFPSAKKISSISSLVYEWRKNPQGITAYSQNRPAALQAYWIISDLIEACSRLGLPKDELYVHNLIMQLSNYCYACVRGMDEDIKRTVFFLCSYLYKEHSAGTDKFRLPYAVKLSQRALMGQNFKLWQLQGKLFQLLK